MKSSRLILFAARWAIMSGFAGTVFAVLVFMERRGSAEPTDDGGLLLASAVLLSIAFILAPFVRNAFVGPRPAKLERSGRKTLLDELRERAPADDASFVATQAPTTTESTQHGTTALRLVIALYVLFGCVLLAVLWAAS